MRTFISSALATAGCLAASGALAASITPASFDATIGVGGSVTVSKTITLDPGGAGRVDIFFLTDDTGSMGSVINSVKTTSSALITALNGVYGDAAFGVGSYDGDPREFDASTPPGSPPGVPLNSPYTRQQMVTTNTAPVLAGIGTWAAGGGGDGPEANFFALHQVATSGGPTDGLGTTDRPGGIATELDTGWRTGAQPVIVWFGDVQSHTTTVDQAEVIAALVANNVIVVGLNSSVVSSGINQLGQAAAITAATGGVLVNSFASVPIGNLVTTIVDAIGEVTSTIDLSFFHTAAAGVGVSFMCTDPLGCTDVPGGASSRSARCGAGGLDRADDDRRAGVSLAAALGVDGDGAVGTLVGFGVGSVGVVGADFAVGGVAVDHRIHVAGGDAEIQRRLAERAEGVGRVPVGLANDADAIALRFQQAPDQRHAEAGVVDVGVAGDEDDVAGVPAERGHLGARHRQKGRRAEARRPVLAVEKQGMRHG